MLNIDFTFLFALLNLLVLYFFLRKFLFGRVNKFMDDRAAAIKADIEKAEKDRAEGEACLKEQQALLQDASNERARMLENARKKAAASYEESIAQARLESSRIVAKAEADAARDKEKAIAQLQDQVASLALTAASKVMQANMETDKNRELVAEFLKDEGVA